MVPGWVSSVIAAPAGHSSGNASRVGHPSSRLPHEAGDTVITDGSEAKAALISSNLEHTLSLQDLLDDEVEKRDQMNKQPPPPQWSDMLIERVLGSGSFATVYRARYRGGLVALNQPHARSSERDLVRPARGEERDTVLQGPG